MGQIVKSIVLEKALRADFMKKWTNTANPADVMDMIMETTSNSNKEKYGWLGETASMVEFKDSRQVRGLNDYDYEIPNKKYESTLGVDEDEIEDDQINGIQTRISDLASKAKSHPRVLFFEAILAGEVELCFDGVAFFSTAHKYNADSDAQSNLITGTKAGGAGVAPTVQEFIADFEKTVAAMQSFLDDQGEPMNEGDLKLKVMGSPLMNGLFAKAFNADQIDSATNTVKGAAAHMTTPRLSGFNWYLAETSGNVKPIIKQLRRDVRFRALEGQSEDGFMTGQFKYGVDYRVGFGYGLWQKMIKVKYA